MKNETVELNDREIEALKSQFGTVTFQRDMVLTYENQVPNTGVIIIEGEIELIKRNKLLDQLKPGTLIGLHNLVRNIPVKFKYLVKAPSLLIMLPKSEIFLFMNDRKSLLYKILSQYK